MKLFIFHFKFISQVRKSKIWLATRNGIHIRRRNLFHLWKDNVRDSCIEIKVENRIGRNYEKKCVHFIGKYTLIFVLNTYNRQYSRYTNQYSNECDWIRKKNIICVWICYEGVYVNFKKYTLNCIKINVVPLTSNHHLLLSIVWVS